MMNKAVCMFLAVALCFFGSFGLMFRGYAEEITTPETAAGTEPVPVTIDRAELVAAIREALTDDAEEPEPTEAPSFWDKSFDEYSPVEAFLLIIVVVLFFFALLIWW